MLSFPPQCWPFPCSSYPHKSDFKLLNFSAGFFEDNVILAEFVLETSFKLQDCGGTLEELGSINRYTSVVFSQRCRLSCMFSFKLSYEECCFPFPGTGTASVIGRELKDVGIPLPLSGGKKLRHLICETWYHMVLYCNRITLCVVTVVNSVCNSFPWLQHFMQSLYFRILR